LNISRHPTAKGGWHFQKGSAMNNGNKVFDEKSEATLFDKIKWMTSKEAAFFLRTSVGQIRNLVWRGKLRAYHYGSRLRFLRSDVDNLMKPAF